MKFTSLQAVVQGMIETEKIKIVRLEKTMASKTKTEVKEVTECQNKIKLWQDELKGLVALEAK